MGPRRRLGVVLYGKQRKLAMPDTFDRPIVQVEMGYFQSRSSRYPFRIANYSKTMVLGCNQHLVIADVTHRVIAAPMTVRQLGSGASICEPYKLMAEADPERWQAGAGEVSNVFQGIPYGGWVTRSIGEEETIGL